MARPHNLQTRYSPEQVEGALMAMTIYGSVSKVAEITGVNIHTLRSWCDKVHRERYLELRRDYAPKVHARLAVQYEDAAAEAIEKARQGIELIDPSTTKAGELPKLVQALVTSAAISTDKARISRDMPTAIVQKQDATELLDSLSRSAPGAIVEGTAEEITA